VGLLLDGIEVGVWTGDGSDLTIMEYVARRGVRSSIGGGGLVLEVRSVACSMCRN
jgi:hypothetical protein